MKVLISKINKFKKFHDNRFFTFFGIAFGALSILITLFVIGLNINLPDITGLINKVNGIVKNFDFDDRWEGVPEKVHLGAKDLFQGWGNISNSNDLLIDVAQIRDSMFAPAIVNIVIIGLVFLGLVTSFSAVFEKNEKLSASGFNIAIAFMSFAFAITILYEIVGNIIWLEILNDPINTIEAAADSAIPDNDKSNMAYEINKVFDEFGRCSLNIGMMVAGILVPIVGVVGMSLVIADSNKEDRKQRKASKALDKELNGVKNFKK